MSFFEKVPEAPADIIFGLNVAFKSDPHPDKLNLVVGAYRTEEGKPFVLSSVKKAEQIIVNSSEFNKEYLPIDGLAEFNKVSAKLIFGDTYEGVSKKTATIQSLSGTGAVRLGAEFIKRFMPDATVYISDPTWPNHKNIFAQAGVPIKTYRYYDTKINGVNLESMISDIQAAPSGSVILLHACAHNPTGADPSLEQWERLAQIIKERKLFPFFDCAYQGFASGDLDKDAQSVRLFVNKGLELFVAQSFAKNCGLYGERIGAFSVVCNSETGAKCVLSQLKSIARATYSNPPAHGAFIVSLILSKPELYNEWRVELKGMADRIHQMRKSLHDQLSAVGVQWPHIMSQIGMFAYTGLTAHQVETLKSKHHVYLTSDGRISLPGLTTKTVPQLVKAIEDVVLAEKQAKLY